ncbi:Zinc finger, CCHC-type [Melia azedarach]|uniref:Zinc finger, CCHC-type n=1 Tax=Melia azedarach TaxID=155640 RepID=A0ACC1XCD2_MELAZ|nr:Zinc finger, CCHC-type [Melia azedarach]
MEVAMIQANIKEDNEATMTRFLNGLNKEISNVVELQPYMKLDDLLYLALKVEKQLKKRASEEENGEEMMPPLEDASDEEGDEQLTMAESGKALVARRVLNMVLHNGYTNHYTFEKDEKKITLVPLLPKEVYEGKLRRMHSEREHKSEEKRVNEDVTKENEFSKGKSGKNNEKKKKVSSNEEGQNLNKGKGVEEKETSELLCKKE